MKKIYTFVPSCDLASSRQTAMFIIWDSSCLLCYLIDGHISFPDAQNKRPMKLQGKQKQSPCSPLPAAARYVGTVNRWEESSRSGLFEYWPFAQTRPKPRPCMHQRCRMPLRKGVWVRAFFRKKQGEKRETKLEMQRSWLT